MDRAKRKCLNNWIVTIESREDRHKQIIQSTVVERAYQIFEERGCKHGFDLQDAYDRPWRASTEGEAYCERLVRSIRRECLDFMILLGQLRRILAEWLTQDKGRYHSSLGPGIPEPAAVFLPLQGHDRHSFVQDCGVVVHAALGSLHHEYRGEGSPREGQEALRDTVH
jgi:hypothetical protein